MEAARLQMDDLRELRAYYNEWAERRRAWEEYCAEDTCEWHPDNSRRGVNEIDLMD